MLKVIRKRFLLMFLGLSLSFVTSSNVLAYGSSEEIQNDMVLKLYGSLVTTNGKIKSSPNSKVQSNNFINKYNSGAFISTGVFLSQNFALELSLGFNVLRVKSTFLSNLANQNNKSIKLGKKNEIFAVPISISTQYYIAPYGGIRPYLGLGYHGSYMITRSKAFSIKNTFGPALQLGIDFYAKDDSMFTFEIKQYFSRTTINYKRVLATPGTSDLIRSKVKINPLIVSLGMGFRF